MFLGIPYLDCPVAFPYYGRGHYENGVAAGPAADRDAPGNRGRAQVSKVTAGTEAA
jgi:hypothetical protein